MEVEPVPQATAGGVTGTAPPTSSSGDATPEEAKPSRLFLTTSASRLRDDNAHKMVDHYEQAGKTSGTFSPAGITLELSGATPVERVHHW
jgi:hypothetical protein